uniref:Uncharacterized protein n=1 Tax=Streptomyces sp. NBC_00003 TaxID=2903608 RepID=A0AAU2UXP4_9ACTN
MFTRSLVSAVLAVLPIAAAVPAHSSSPGDSQMPTPYRRCPDGTALGEKNMGSYTIHQCYDAQGKEVDAVSVTAAEFHAREEMNDKNIFISDRNRKTDITPVVWDR